MHLKIALLNPLYNFMVTTNKTNIFWWTPKLDKSKVREQKLKKNFMVLFMDGVQLPQG